MLVRNSIAFVACFLLALSSSLCSGNDRVEISYYEGRSGNIILKPKIMQDNPFLIVSSANGKSQSLDDTLVSELVSYLIGGPIIQADSNIERDSLASAVEGLPVSTFDKYKANLFVSIAGLGSDAVEQYSTLKLFSRGKHIPITKTAYPQDTAATMATLATGRTPSQHGVVSSFWKTPIGSFSAYRAQALPTVASVTDIISQTFGGQSLIVSASGCYQMASAMGLHQYLQVENPYWNSLGYYYNADNKQFESLYVEDPKTAHPLDLSKDQLIASLASRKFSSAIEYLQTRDVVVHLNGASVQFDLAKEEDFLLFAELEFALSLLDQLKGDADLTLLVKDNVPDLYFLSFSSIAKLKAKYGDKSAEVDAALLVVDEILSQIIDQFSALYDNQLGNEIMFLGSNNAVSTLQLDENLRESVYPVVRKFVRSQESYNTFFPVIYLEKESATICDQVGKALPNYVEVYCPERTSFYFEHILQQTNNSNNSNSTTDSNDRASTFQIVLWMSIILALFLFGAAYSLFAMDIGADSLLYRMTSGKLHSN